MPEGKGMNPAEIAAARRRIQELMRGKPLEKKPIPEPRTTSHHSGRELQERLNTLNGALKRARNFNYPRETITALQNQIEQAKRELAELNGKK